MTDLRRKNIALLGLVVIGVLSTSSAYAAVFYLFQDGRMYLFFLAHIGMVLASSTLVMHWSGEPNRMKDALWGISANVLATILPHIHIATMLAPIVAEHGFSAVFYGEDRTGIAFPE